MPDDIHRADRKPALRAIEGQLRMALRCNQTVTEIVREHGFAIPLPPDKPLLEALTHVAVLLQKSHSATAQTGPAAAALPGGDEQNS